LIVMKLVSGTVLLMNLSKTWCGLMKVRTLDFTELVVFMDAST